MRKGACQKHARSEGKHWTSCSSSPSWEILPSHCPTSFASSKTQVSCVHFSGLTPGENLPFTRALIPQASLTLMASALVPPYSLHQLYPAIPLKAFFFVQFIISVSLHPSYRTLLRSHLHCFWAPILHHSPWTGLLQTLPNSKNILCLFLGFSSPLLTCFQWGTPPTWCHVKRNPCSVSHLCHSILLLRCCSENGAS